MINENDTRRVKEAALARLTWEVQCSEWHCDCQGTLVKQIQKAWPQFNLKSLQ